MTNTPDPKATAAASAVDAATAKDLKRQELQNQLDALTEKPKPLAELASEELHTMFMDELVSLLGSHPRLEAIWQELKARMQ